MQRSFADGREYYMLAYTPSNETEDGKFRKIEVQVRDKKARVNAKRGYWALCEVNAKRGHAYADRSIFSDNSAASFSNSDVHSDSRFFSMSG